MSDAAQKKTALYEEHVRLGAKMIPFGDWIMPVQYSSIIDEHQAVRNNVGVFDISVPRRPDGSTKCSPITPRNSKSAPASTPFC